MLDEHLPTFLLQNVSGKAKQGSTFYFTQNGSEPEPVYTLRYANSDDPQSKNCYAAGLCDAHNSDILFAEVLVVPEWTQTSKSSEASSLNNEASLTATVPGEFVVRLYNPSQQIKVTQKLGSWSSAPTWYFELPQRTFREPSASAIDHAQKEPAASELTPRICLKWKKDSKFNKDMTCYLSGSTMNVDGTRRKNREPDITVAIFYGLKQMILYEPNLQRVEMEDIKGLEIVLLFSATVIRDVYFGSIQQAFTLDEQAGRRRGSETTGGSFEALDPGTRSNALLSKSTQQVDLANVTSSAANVPTKALPLPGTASQSLNDVVKARRRKESEGKEKEIRRRHKEEKETRKLLEAEERARLRRQAEIDKETDRLKRIYLGSDQSAPRLPTRTPPSVQFQKPTQIQPNVPRAWAVHQHPGPPFGRSHPPQSPYLQASGGYAPQSGYLSPHQATPQQHQLRGRKSLWGFRNADDGDSSKLLKKRSSMF